MRKATRSRVRGQEPASCDRPPRSQPSHCAARALARLDSGFCSRQTYRPQSGERIHPTPWVSTRGKRPAPEGGERKRFTRRILNRIYRRGRLDVPPYFFKEPAKFVTTVTEGLTCCATWSIRIFL